MTDNHDDWDAGPLASELIGAGRRERASDGARELATQTLLAGMMAPSAAAASSTWSASLKWLGISVMLGVGGGLGYLAVHRPDHVERLAHLGHTPARSTQEVLVDSARSSIASAAPSLAAPLASAPLPRSAMPSAVAASQPSATPAAAEVRGEADLRLAQELLALKRARAAVAAGAPQQALSTLDGVAGGFQVLPLEASLVRIEALRRAGKRDAARALSEQLLRAHPDGPYTERLRSLAAGSD